nr:MAG TPA: 6-pyruvoyl tetrahydropterin synthase [Caudoviricetes sp.]
MAGLARSRPRRLRAHPRNCRAPHGHEYRHPRLHRPAPRTRAV